MSSPFVAEIRMFAGNFAPTGWATCDGQLMPISQNTALFSLIGTFYGGDGQSTFGLPNFENSAPVHQGQGPGLSDRFIGEASGEPFVTLLQSEMPAHSHFIQAYTGDPGDTRTPGPAESLAGPVPGNAYQTSNANLASMHPSTLSVAGSGLPHNNMQPYLVVTFLIALQGIFPARG